MEEAAAGDKRRLVLAGIDHIGVFLAGLRFRAEPDNAILAVKDNLAARRHVARHHGRNADAQIDIGAFGQILRGSPGHLFTAQRLDRHASAPTTTTRSTKMLGVTTA